MSRRAQAPVRSILPDPKFNNEMLAKLDRKSTRLNSSHSQISYAVFCLKKKIRDSSKGPNCFSDVVNQKTSLPVLDHLTARAEVHRDDGHASGIGFDQDKSDSLRDGVQVQ